MWAQATTFIVFVAIDVARAFAFGAAVVGTTVQPQTIVVVGSVMSTLSGVFAVYYVEGMYGFRQMSLKGVLAFSVSACCFSGGQTFNVAQHLFITPQVAYVLGQAYLPILAYFSRGILGKAQSNRQWLSIFLITLSSVCFCVARGGQYGGLSLEKFLTGIICNLLSTIGAVFGSLYMERFMTRDAAVPFARQKFQMDISFTAFAIVLLYVSPALIPNKAALNYRSYRAVLTCAEPVGLTDDDLNTGIHDVVRLLQREQGSTASLLETLEDVGRSGGEHALSYQSNHVRKETADDREALLEMFYPGAMVSSTNDPLGVQSVEIQANGGTVNAEQVGSSDADANRDVASRHLGDYLVRKTANVDRTALLEVDSVEIQANGLVENQATQEAELATSADKDHESYRKNVTKALERLNIIQKNSERIDIWTQVYWASPDKPKPNLKPGDKGPQGCLILCDERCKGLKDFKGNPASPTGFVSDFEQGFWVGWDWLAWVCAIQVCMFAWVASYITKILGSMSKSFGQLLSMVIIYFLGDCFLFRDTDIGVNNVVMAALVAGQLCLNTMEYLVLPPYVENAKNPKIEGSK